MSFISPVPSQEDAVKYLNATCSYIRGRLYVGGHSKGGNLAIYSAINCNKRVKKKLNAYIIMMVRDLIFQSLKVRNISQCFHISGVLCQRIP